ncbi:MAG: hypothetical protein ABSH07_03570 [Candidatus Dormibacteria bacterium]
MSAPAAGGPTPPRHRPGSTRHQTGLAGLALLAAATALVAACGSTSSPSTGSVAAATAPVVKVAMVTVNGTSEQVLTTSSGDTLYYPTKDSATSVTCTGTCASTWPPLLLASGQPTAASSLPDALSVVSGGNGRQVEYDGHPLYRYAGDSGPDQSNGEGIDDESIDGVWFVATPTMTSSSGSSASATPSAASVPAGY